MTNSYRVSIVAANGEDRCERTVTADGPEAAGAKALEENGDPGASVERVRLSADARTEEKEEEARRRREQADKHKAGRT